MAGIAGIIMWNVAVSLGCIIGIIRWVAVAAFTTVAVERSSPGWGGSIVVNNGKLPGAVTVNIGANCDDACAGARGAGGVVTLEAGRRSVIEFKIS